MKYSTTTLASFFATIFIPLLLGIGYYFLTNGNGPESIQQLLIVYLIGLAIVAITVFLLYSLVFLCMCILL